MKTKLNVKLISHTLSPEITIATAGKLCYSPSNINQLMDNLNLEESEKFLNRLLSMGHESPLEHVSFTFAVEGISRACSHQLVRHRIASYSQQSQRYVKLDQFEYVIPNDIKFNNKLKLKYEQQMKNIQVAYNEITKSLLVDYVYDTENFGEYLNLQLKKCKIDKEEFNDFKDKYFCNGEEILIKLKEQYKKLYSTLEKKAIENARYLFPNACETKIIVTMNLRTLINFCKHRCCRRAQEEINELAWEMKKQVEQVSPILSKCLGASCQFGSCPEGAMCCGKPYPKIKEC